MITEGQARPRVPDAAIHRARTGPARSRLHTTQPAAQEPTAAVLVPLHQLSPSRPPRSSPGTALGPGPGWQPGAALESLDEDSQLDG